MKAAPSTLVDAARLIALEASVHSGRIELALRNMADADGFLAAAITDGSTSGSGTISDPTSRLAGRLIDGKSIGDLAGKDRALLEELLLAELNASRRIAGILATWNPDLAEQDRIRSGNNDAKRANDNDGWCTNHKRHGMDSNSVPGRKLCSWCQDFTERSDNPKKLLPTRWILDVRSRRRITAADVAHELRLQADEAATLKAEPKATISKPLTPSQQDA